MKSIFILKVFKIIFIIIYYYLYDYINFYYYFMFYYDYAIIKGERYIVKKKKNFFDFYKSIYKYTKSIMFLLFKII